MIVDAIFTSYIKYRLNRINGYLNYPIEAQHQVFSDLIQKGSLTQFGQIHGFSSVHTSHEFTQRVPLQFYDDLEPYIKRGMLGEKDVLWPGTTKWYAKSSGTTGGRIKILPVTEDSLFQNHYANGKDLLAIYHRNFPNRKLYSKKHLILGGSHTPEPMYKHATIADLSAIIIDNLPFWTEFRRIPDKSTVFLNDWAVKLNKVAEQSIKEDVAILAGMPSWIVCLCSIVLQISEKSTLREVWPNLELYIHGGQHLGPYQKQLDKLFGSDELNYVESYNASEGYFGLQDQSEADGLLLLTDSHIYFEFIPMSDYDGKESKTVLSLEDVETGVDYALVISTSAGLWRYIIGDTIQFISTHPYRFKVSGRTTQYINSFGEKMVMLHAEQAIKSLSDAFQLNIENYTIAPYFSFDKGIGGHEWAIEFSEPVEDLDALSQALDVIMRGINSDYDTKRSGNLNILPLKIVNLKRGSFHQWMKNNGKFGGQHKIPRLSNDRKFLEEVQKISHQMLVH